MRLTTLMRPAISNGIALIALLCGCNGTDLVGPGGDCPGPDCADLSAPTTPATPPVTTITIDPPQATLQFTGGAPPSQTFTLHGRRSDGSDAGPLAGLWSVKLPLIGTIDASRAIYTATGEAGGVDTVHVELARSGMTPLSANAQVTVVVQRTITAPGTPADAASKFGTLVTDATHEAQLAYPLADAVMPQNVAPAQLQWLRGAAGDLFRVTLAKTRAKVVAYTLHTGAAFTSSWLVDAAAWRSLAQTDVDEPLSITVDRYEAATKTAYAGKAISMRFTKGALLGSIYYWAIEQGRILRIDDGSGSAVGFMPTPPTSPVDKSNCIGCHTVSPDGRYMMGRLGGGDNVGTTFDLTRDLTGNPAPTEIPVTATGTRWMFATYSPDSSRMMTSTVTKLLQLVDPKTGAIVAPKSGALPTAAIYPRWSPDGKTIAYTSGADDWGGQPTKGELSVLPVTAQDTFGAPRRLLGPADVAAASPAGTVISYPTWTPDSKWLAFGLGPLARSATGTGSMYLVGAAGGATARLTRAVGGPATTDCFVPSFSPFHTPGYFWLVFLSRRDYGNALAGTQGKAMQQIWVAAIRDTPTAGTDPSEVGYWLPGQSTATRNISAYWAPKACRKDSEVCSVGSECCGGLCVQGRCQPPPVDKCRTEGQTCGGGGCCPGLLCDVNNICSSILG